MSTLRNGRITQLVILQWLAALPANSVDTLVQLRYKIDFALQSHLHALEQTWILDGAKVSWLKNWTWKEEILPGPVFVQSVKVTLSDDLPCPSRNSRKTSFVSCFVQNS